MLRNEISETLPRLGAWQLEDDLEWKNQCLSQWNAKVQRQDSLATLLLDSRNV